jgi:transposase
LIPYHTRGWFLVGSRPTIKYVQTPYLKTCAFGALSAEGIITKLSKKVNGKKYFAFIKRLFKHNKRMVLIVDNARWHLTEEILGFIRANKIKLIRLPPYSPELNPIEQYWKNVKNWLATRAWSSLPELIKELRCAFRKSFLVPDISDY